MLFLQEIYQLKCGLDETLSEQLRAKWERILKNIDTSAIFISPRNYLGTWNLCDVKDVELHGFCDASGKAYAAVVYVCFKSLD